MVLIIIASLLSSYGKNVAKPRYEPKDLQFRKKILHVSEAQFIHRASAVPSLILELCST